MEKELAEQLIKGLQSCSLGIRRGMILTLCMVFMLRRRMSIRDH